MELPSAVQFDFEAIIENKLLEIFLAATDIAVRHHA